MSAVSAIPEPVRTEAERWFGLMMVPDCPPERLIEFKQWLQAEAMHRQAYLEVERLWEQLGDVVLRPGVRVLPEAAPPAPPLEAQLAVLEFRARPPAHSQPWRHWGVALAACLALIVFGMYAWRLPQSPQAVFQTAIGESRSITLDDGSMVTLDTDSRIAVALDARKRTIILQRGAAFFDVTPDATRPFTVRTPYGSVTVLGTQFQVRQDAVGAQVVLVKGSVQLDAPEAGAEALLLRPGQQARRDAGGGWQVASADPDSIAWRQGRLVFRVTPLSQAVAEVNRYTAHKVGIGDPSLQTLTVSGVFRTGDPDSFVLVLENSLPVRVQVEDGERRLLRRR